MIFLQCACTQYVGDLISVTSRVFLQEAEEKSQSPGNGSLHGDSSAAAQPVVRPSSLELRGWLECEALLSHAETREGLGRCLRLGAQVRGQLSDGNIALRRTEHHSIWVIQPGDPDVFI